MPIPCSHDLTILYDAAPAMALAIRALLRAFDGDTTLSAQEWIDLKVGPRISDLRAALPEALR